MTHYEFCPISHLVENATRTSLGIPDSVRIALHITPEDTPVRGNASAWGEPEDSEYAAEIEERLDRGELWAWCTVRVTCTDGFTKGEAYLGGCSYDDAAAFVDLGLGYFLDLAAEAYAEYQSEVARIREKYTNNGEADALHDAARSLLADGYPELSHYLSRTAESLSN